MNTRCERYGIAFFVICGRSRVLCHVTYGRLDTSDTSLALFIFIPNLYYPHNIFIITNHHRIIISKISPAIANVLSNLSEVSGVKYCTHDLQAVSGDSRLYGEKYAVCAVFVAQAACRVLSCIILLPQHPAAEAFSLLRGIFRSHSLLSQPVLTLCPASPL